MKHLIYKALLILLALLPISCDRSGIWEKDYDVIEWNFCATVVADDNMTQPISGATVEIYSSKEDRASGANAIGSKSTDSKGEALFTFADFDKQNRGPEACKGNYYLKVTANGKVVEATTKYLLMNSGTTYQWVVVK